MADAVVNRIPVARFFCHRCNVEFEDRLQDYVCPFCAGGFIEQLEAVSDAGGSVASGDDPSDGDMDMEDGDETITDPSPTHAVLDDIAFLMSGRRMRGGGAGSNAGGGARPEGLLEQLVWSISGGAPGAMTGAITGGAPLVLVGAPGDYVFGGDGLDAVVTQLLGQLENSGPAPLTRDQIASIPSVQVTAEQAAAETACSVCWDNFQEGEKVSRLECDHIFHSSCIEPWLQLHATCPICRRGLEIPRDPAANNVGDSNLQNNRTGPIGNNAVDGNLQNTAASRLGNLSRTIATITGLRPRLQLLSELHLPSYTLPASTPSSTSVSSGSSIMSGVAAGVTLHVPRSNRSTDTTDSTMSVNSTDADVERTSSYNMDLDFD